jgi:transcriptional regulator with XRE-family HTH domain
MSISEGGARRSMLASYLKWEKERRGWSWRKAEAATGVGRTALINTIEKAGAPFDETLDKIAEGLHVSGAFLRALRDGVFGEDDMARILAVRERVGEEEFAAIIAEIEDEEAAVWEFLRSRLRSLLRRRGVASPD